MVKFNGEVIGDTALSYAGVVSTFAGEYVAKKAGVYEFIVYAYDARTGNTGVDRVSIRVSD